MSGDAVHTPLELTRLAADHLRERGIENARLEAELLLAAVLGVKRLDLYLQFERPLTEQEVAAYRAVVRRRAKREPYQYIVGEAHFRELVLAVDERVLIPRPETEQLVGEVLAWAVGRGAGLTALDVGTGSGAIALSLLREGPFVRVVATDSSADALAVVRENAGRLGLEAGLELRHGAGWAAVGAQERFDVVVSNPPYVPEGDFATLQPEVRDWEPRAALLAGPRGVEVLEELVAEAAAHLVGGGLLALEVGLGQAREVATRLAETGEFAPARIVEDHAGRERHVLAERLPLANRGEMGDHGA